MTSASATARRRGALTLGEISMYRFMRSKCALLDI
jgi:hypothetical protein